METCSGLMWVKSAPLSWSCRADAHVYNVRIGPEGWAPDPRAGLSWLCFMDRNDPPTSIFVQVQEERASAVQIEHLEIDGRTVDLQQS
jgi:hypothetical protein